MNSKHPCIILFARRTGSSLIAQTLKLLGKPVLGNFETNHPQTVNPKGFWALPELRDNGLTQQIRERYAEQLKDHAYKILQPNFLKSEKGHWGWVRQHKPLIFKTFRHPLEQVLSDTINFRKKQPGTSEYFIQVTYLLIVWEVQMRHFSTVIQQECPELCERTAIVGYHEHLQDPTAFVEKIRRHAGLNPSPEQVKTAIDNIDGSLYRFQYANFDEEHKRWYSQLPCSQIYEHLLQDPQALWQYTMDMP